MRPETWTDRKTGFDTAPVSSGSGHGEVRSLRPNYVEMGLKLRVDARPFAAR